MSEVIQTGVAELREAAKQLPLRVTQALQRNAEEIAYRIQADARRLLQQQTRGSGATANAIVVVQDVPNKQYRVESHAPQQWWKRTRDGFLRQRDTPAPANLPTWLEWGTARMSAKPYMRPAMDQNRARYEAGCEAAATGVVAGTLS
jgi:HK97 gp10 family phage protein